MKYVFLLALAMLSIPVLAEESERSPSSISPASASLATDQANAPIANMDSDAILREIQSTMERVDVSADTSEP